MNDGVEKFPTPCVVAVFQELDMLYVCLRSRKMTTPCGPNILLSLRFVYASSL